MGNGFTGQGEKAEGCGGRRGEWEWEEIKAQEGGRSVEIKENATEIQSKVVLVTEKWRKLR